MEVLASKIAEHGILGIMCAICLLAVYKIFKMYEEVQEKRIKEGLAYREDAREFANVIRILTEKVSAGLRGRDSRRGGGE